MVEKAERNKRIGGMNVTLGVRSHCSQRGFISPQGGGINRGASVSRTAGSVPDPARAGSRAGKAGLDRHLLGEWTGLRPARGAGRDVKAPFHGRSRGFDGGSPADPRLPWETSLS